MKMNPRVVAQRGAYAFLLEEEDGSAAVLNIEGAPSLLPARSTDAVLARGYWSEVEADPVRVRELAFRVAVEGVEIPIRGFAQHASGRELRDVHVEPDQLRPERREVRALAGLTLLEFGFDPETVVACINAMHTSSWIIGIASGPIAAQSFVGSSPTDLTAALGDQPNTTLFVGSVESRVKLPSPATAPAR